MDTVGDEVWKSVRLAWREERWLPVGVPVAAVAYALWIGLTGAAVTTLADAVAGGLALDPWTGLTDVVVLVLVILWVLGPAALATLLVRDRVTNVRGNLATGYRLRHPLLLFLPPSVVLLAGLGTVAATGATAGPAFLLATALLVVGGVWFLVRGVAYAYRVFALAFPAVEHIVVFITSIVVGVTSLVLGLTAIGREALVDTLATGLAARTGIDAIARAPDATTAVLGVPIPTLVAAVVAVPVGLTAGYVGLQLAASVVARIVKPTVRRPQLRTGQRYPAFARPTSGTAASSPTPASGGSTAEAEPSAAGEADSEAADAETPVAPADESPSESAETPSESEDDAVETNVSHTRVYSPPEDADSVDPDAVGTTAGTTICPDCGATVASDEDTCPDCGATL